jgi:calcineurin-like phosphoesterase family protein
MITVKKIHQWGYLELEGNPENIWFTSDPHFDHKNIIKLCNRPFDTTEEMNLALIANWNKYVDCKDWVFILGDFCWSGDHLRWKRILDQLNGVKVLIKGNHDDYKVLERISGEFYTIRERLEFRNDGQRYMFDHYPQYEWNGSYHGVMSLFGHIHEKDNPIAKVSSYNVSVERNDYRPISLNEINMLVTKQARDNKLNLKLSDLQ